MHLISLPSPLSSTPPNTLAVFFGSNEHFTTFIFLRFWWSRPSLLLEWSRNVSRQRAAWPPSNESRREWKTRWCCCVLCVMRRLESHQTMEILLFQFLIFTIATESVEEKLLKQKTEKKRTHNIFHRNSSRWSRFIYVPHIGSTHRSPTIEKDQAPPPPSFHIYLSRIIIGNFTNSFGYSSLFSQKLLEEWETKAEWARAMWTALA